ncbi:MAG: hypothetical protein GX956_00875 [Firmicutes bacterium]|nr:hypothetical protein [Bacillota bacterium]
MANACCGCPRAWSNFIGDWVFVQVLNSTIPFGDSQWQLREVESSFIVLRRPIGPSCWQHAVVRCAEIVALVEAPPPPIVG